MIKQEKGQLICEKYDKLKAARHNFDVYWEYIAQFVIPNQADFITKRYKGDLTRTNQIYDTTAPRALRLLAASIVGAIFTGKWFGLVPRVQGEAEKSDEFKSWLSEVADQMLAAFNDSNFGVQAAQNIKTGTGFGTAGLTVENSSSSLFFEKLTFRDEHLKDFVFDEDADGKPGMIYREIILSATAAYVKYVGIQNELPADVWKDINDKYDSKSDEKIHFIHAIEPIELHDDQNHYEQRTVDGVKQKIPKGDYYSCVIHKETGEAVEESWEVELPIIIWRWDKITGDQYGWSEAMIAMADIITLNEIKRLELGAVEKNILPPKEIAIGALANGKLSRKPNGITRVNKNGQIQNLDEPYDLRLSSMTSEELKESIKSCFHEQELVLPQSGSDTATEVRLRYDLMQRLLGATFQRIKTELLNPLISRVFRIMYDGGAFPELPEIEGLSSDEIDVEYMSPLARSEKQAEVDSSFEMVAAFAQAIQIEEQGRAGSKIAQAFDPYEFLETLEKAKSVPPKILMDKKKWEAAVEETQKQQQAAIEAQREHELKMKGGESEQA